MYPAGVGRVDEGLPNRNPDRGPHNLGSGSVDREARRHISGVQPFWAPSGGGVTPDEREPATTMRIPRPGKCDFWRVGLEASTESNRYVVEADEGFIRKAWSRRPESRRRDSHR